MAEAEKEYIERDAAKRIIKANEWKNPVVPNVVNMILDRIPTADVVEVRHGEWTEDYTRQFCDGSYETGYHCSLCQRKAAVAHEVFDGKGRKLLLDMYPYCHCGAKMDGGKREKV